MKLRNCLFPQKKYLRAVRASIGRNAVFLIDVVAEMKKPTKVIEVSQRVEHSLTEHLRYIE